MSNAASLNLLFLFLLARLPRLGTEMGASGCPTMNMSVGTDKVAGNGDSETLTGRESQENTDARRGEVNSACVALFLKEEGRGGALTRETARETV